VIGLRKCKAANHTPEEKKWRGGRHDKGSNHFREAGGRAWWRLFDEGQAQRRRFDVGGRGKQSKKRGRFVQSSRENIKYASSDVGHYTRLGEVKKGAGHWGGVGKGGKLIKGGIPFFKAGGGRVEVIQGTRSRTRKLDRN